MISHIPGASRTNVGGFIKNVRSAGRFAQPQPSGAPLYLKERAEAFMLKKDWEFHRGELYYANLNPFFGSEQGGNRPVLVLQNNIGNIYCPTLIVAPLTSNIYKKASQPTITYWKASGACVASRLFFWNRSRPSTSAAQTDISANCPAIRWMGLMKRSGSAWILIFPKKWKHRNIPGRLFYIIAAGSSAYYNGLARHHWKSI
jgi:hypothetical protein